MWIIERIIGTTIIWEKSYQNEVYTTVRAYIIIILKKS